MWLFLFFFFSKLAKVGFFLAAAVITGKGRRRQCLKKKRCQVEDILFLFLSFFNSHYISRGVQEEKKFEWEARKGERGERERENPPETLVCTRFFKWNVDGGFSRRLKSKKQNEITQEPNQQPLDNYIYPIHPSSLYSTATYHVPNIYVSFLRSRFRLMTREPFFNKFPR